MRIWTWFFIPMLMATAVMAELTAIDGHMDYAGVDCLTTITIGVCLFANEKRIVFKRGLYRR